MPEIRRASKRDGCAWRAGAGNDRLVVLASTFGYVQVWAPARCRETVIITLAPIPETTRDGRSGKHDSADSLNDQNLLLSVARGSPPIEHEKHRGAYRHTSAHRSLFRVTAF